MNPLDRDRPSSLHSFKATLAILAVALAGVALLFGLGRANWFHLRPASGTAAAMWHATAPATAPMLASAAPPRPATPTPAPTR